VYSTVVRKLDRSDKHISDATDPDPRSRFTFMRTYKKCFSVLSSGLAYQAAHVMPARTFRIIQNMYQCCSSSGLSALGREIQTSLP